MRTSLMTFFVAIFFHAALYGQTVHRHVLDDRIDSLQKLIARAAPDTSKVDLYLELMTRFGERYMLRGLHAADSVGIFKTAEACLVLSKKLHYAYGEGSCLLQEARMYGILKNLPASDTRLQQAFSVFRTAHNAKGLANAYLYKSNLSPLADRPLRIKFCDTAIQLARQCHDPKLEAWILTFRADLHYQQLDHTIAIQELSTALELQKRWGDTRTHFTTDLLAEVYMASGKKKEALECAIASLDNSRKVNDTAYIANYYRKLGIVYNEMKSPKEAFYNFERALLATVHTNYNRHLAIVLLGLMAGCLKDQGKPREAISFFNRALKKYPPVTPYAQHYSAQTYFDLYRYVKNFKEAEKYLQKIVNPAREIAVSPVDQMQVYTAGAMVYLELKQYDKAARYADTAYAMAQRSNSRINLISNSGTLSKLEEVKGNYKKALQYYKTYNEHAVLAEKELADKRILELSVQYETDQKNSQLNLLTKQSRLHEETIKQGKVLRNFMIAASVLLLLFLLLIFNRYRVKQRANRLLQEKQDEINWQNQTLEKMVQEEKKITAEKDKLLQEKEWLMKEINHRVKNNLQVVMSLLNTQSAYLKDEAALNAIRESRHRVHAISLIHRKLYQSDRQLTTIDMAAYIKEVSDYLADSLDPQNRIGFGLFIDPIQLDVAQAVPTGLIINEAVTNAVKYAFSDGRKAQINISMHKKVNGTLELAIQDNGTGLPPGFNWRQTDSLGMSLMQGLCRQLDGEFDVLQQDGLTIKISFEPAKVLNQ